MKKRIYRAVNVKKVIKDKLAEAIQGLRIVIGLDVHKEDCFACLMDQDRDVHITMMWKHPDQTRLLVELIKDLPVRSLEVAMEPSGTYGDPLRHLLQEAGIRVYRVSPKRSHDAAEVYDGVPSSHDRKSAAIVAKLHLDGASEPWAIERDQERDLKAAISIMDRYSGHLDQNKNRLEAILSRHWPEVLGLMSLESVSLWVLLKRVGGPEQVARQAYESRKVLRRVGGHLLAQDKIEAVVASAQTTVGCPMSVWERRALEDLAKDTRRAYREMRKAKKEVKRQGAEHPAVCAMAPTLGLATAAVIVSKVGNPGDFSSAPSYEKAAGLNLKERSSGRHQGQRKITKRGSGEARRWLYMAALRLIQNEVVVRKWYERKVVRDGGKIKGKGIVAIMRKIIRAMWHVGQGEVFEVEKLFDVNRLHMKTS